jgi:hypothetical protein
MPQLAENNKLSALHRGLVTNLIRRLSVDYYNAQYSYISENALLSTALCFHRMLPLPLNIML